MKKAVAIMTATSLSLLGASIQGSSAHAQIAKQRASVASKPASAIRSEPVRQQPISVPECKVAGQDMTVDLSTRTTAGADQRWSVTGPSQSGLGGPIHAVLSAWTAIAGNWIQPFSTPSSDRYGNAKGSAKGGTYTYKVQFTLPCDPESYKGLTITGKIAGDNSFVAYLNSPSANLATCNGSGCFKGTGTNVSFGNQSGFRPGLNQVIVVVKNNGTSYTGMAADLKLRLSCGEKCCKTLPKR